MILNEPQDSQSRFYLHTLALSEVHELVLEMVEIDSQRENLGFPAELSTSMTLSFSGSRHHAPTEKEANVH